MIKLTFNTSYFYFSNPLIASKRVSNCVPQGQNSIVFHGGPKFWDEGIPPKNGQPPHLKCNMKLNYIHIQALHYIVYLDNILFDIHIRALHYTVYLGTMQSDIHLRALHYTVYLDTMQSDIHRRALHYTVYQNGSVPAVYDEVFL